MKSIQTQKANRSFKNLRLVFHEIGEVGWLITVSKSYEISGYHTERSKLFTAECLHESLLEAPNPWTKTIDSRPRVCKIHEIDQSFTVTLLKGGKSFFI